MIDESYAPSDLRYDLSLTLEEAVAGKTVTVRYPRIVRCGQCDGRGIVASGGRFFKHTNCAGCDGRGARPHMEEIRVRTPRGVETGSRIRIAGKGGEAPGGHAGDLYIVTHVSEDENFERRGVDLYTEAGVDAALLASGGFVDVKTLVDGVKRLRIPVGTEEGTVFRLRGCGVSSLSAPDQRGDLFVSIRKTEPDPAAAKETAASPPDPAAAQAGPSRADEPRAADEPAPDGGASPDLRVFLCHSSGDKPAVRALYHRLRADGMTPWLDEEDLLPGEKWEKEIPKAVRGCDVVIVCLSQGSINRRGYLQKEIRHALEAADEQPEGAIFLIPVKLEECEIPEHLSRWQWVNLFEEHGYARLMRALRKRAQSL